ncbi:hypothetical protein BDW68DRAFT_170907 [Aspergillus falconensis]
MVNFLQNHWRGTSPYPQCQNHLRQLAFATVWFCALTSVYCQLCCLILLMMQAAVVT